MTDAVQPTTAQLLEAAAAAFLPMAGPYGIAAQAALTAGLQFWADFSAKNDAGTLTMADLEAVAAQTNTDLAQLTADVK